ncbi:MAG: beta-propeller domain-containing protein [Oscillospiraceae bacterium]|nr:beta-propeller domain-containing protein [Oscillospiraceae bacterium]
MSFDKELERAVGEIKIPDSLSPENMEQMLRAANVVQLEPDDIPELLISEKLDRKKIRMSKRSVFIRTAAAAAAFAALAGGFAALNANNAHIDPIASEKDYMAVQEVQSYGELYDIYTGISNEQSGAANGDGVEIPTEPAVTVVSEPAPVTTEPVPEVTVPVSEPGPVVTEMVHSDFSDADIVKSSDSHIYYLCGDTVYSVEKSGMKTDSKTVSGISPFEMYISGDSLILIGKGTDSGMYRTAAEIYDISGGTPELAHDYSLGGDYVSARSEDGIVFLVTGLTGSAMEDSSGIESYVPSYYADGVRAFLSASDISVPQTANNTDYTIMTMINAASGRVSAKAVLGNAEVYCSADTLYVIGSAVEDGSDVTYVTSFSVYDGVLEYKASAKLKGALISRSMAETEGLFRIACSTEDGTNIYSLNDALETVNSSEGLMPDKVIGSVKFEDSVAVLNEKHGPDSVLVVDLTRSTEVEDKTFFTGSVNKLTDDISISFTKNDEGLCITAVGPTGEIEDSYSFETADADSEALRDKNAMLIDSEHMVIGIPVESGDMSRYYIFSYNGGIMQLGVVDSPDGVPFERAVVDGDRVIMIGRDGMVTVALDELAGSFAQGYEGEKIAFLP